MAPPPYIDYFMNNLDMRFPLADLLSSKLAETLSARVRAIYYVEQASIAGVPCDHLAFRGDQADAQLWIARGDQPLPYRLVITYKKAEGQPQFWAQFSDWNLSPDIPDSLFVFTPPEGAAKIAFASPKPVQTGGGNGKARKERGHDVHDLEATDGLECPVRDVHGCGGGS
jgi:hypothetical protein